MKKVLISASVAPVSAVCLRACSLSVLLSLVPLLGCEGQVSGPITGVIPVGSGGRTDNPAPGGGTGGAPGTGGVNGSTSGASGGSSTGGVTDTTSSGGTGPSNSGGAGPSNSGGAGPSNTGGAAVTGSGGRTTGTGGSAGRGTGGTAGRTVIPDGGAVDGGVGGDARADGGVSDGGSDGAPVSDPFSVPATCTSKTNWTGGNRGNASMNPGLACINCHSSSGGPGFSIAGTIYPTGHEPSLCDGANGNTGARIVITGADGRVITLTPNAAGNFYSSGTVAKPYHAKVTYMGRERMMSAAQTSGDCNSCHTQTGTNMAPGRVVLP